MPRNVAARARVGSTWRARPYSQDSSTRTGTSATLGACSKKCSCWGRRRAKRSRVACGKCKPASGPARGFTAADGTKTIGRTKPSQPGAISPTRKPTRCISSASTDTRCGLIAQPWRCAASRAQHRILPAGALCETRPANRLVYSSTKRRSSSKRKFHPPRAPTRPPTRRAPCRSAIELGLVGVHEAATTRGHARLVAAARPAGNPHAQRLLLARFGRTGVRANVFGAWADARNSTAGWWCGHEAPR